jgi:3-oxoacyl-[acyl-carrier protein] reductase
VDLGLTGKRALVLGASRGIGRAIAETLVREGARVAIGARDQARLAEAAQAIGATAAQTCDLLAPGDAARWVQAASAALGGVDVLVVNTGGPKASHFADTTPALWQTQFQNLWLSTVEAAQVALPAMRAQKWGRVLLVSSVAAREPMPSLTVSNGLRAGLLGLMKSLANEVASDGVTVNTLLPGYTRTERLAELGLAEEKMTAEVPARRLGEPKELAALAAFIASVPAGYITGQAIACDGGYLRGT